ncbi:ATP-binding cassette domain-containing protein [Paenibacillus sp. HWE-109]|uniref:ATP-binding cassette domain-containing protein n=1 Tax=Paenibacillus sp. HWE-109 TaxID=1306526 RepID=UPI00308093F5
MPLIYRGMTRKQREPLVWEALQEVNLLDRKGDLPSELSGGQQQRAAIARTLAGDPPIILITHDGQVAEQAKRVVRFRDGRLFH